MDGLSPSEWGIWKRSVSGIEACEVAINPLEEQVITGVEKYRLLLSTHEFSDAIANGDLSSYSVARLAVILAANELGTGYLTPEEEFRAAERVLSFMSQGENPQDGEA